MKRFILTAAVFSLTLAAPAAASTDMNTWHDKRVEVEGPDGELHKLTRVSAEVVVDASPEEVWDLLADFGDVQEHFLAIVDSDWIGEPVLGNGAARFCDISFQGKDVHVKERIFDFNEGDAFTYDVYDWENFPLKRMHNTFGVYVNADDQTVVYNLIDFKLKPAIMTGLARGTMSDSARATMLSIKHLLETGDSSLNADELHKMYPRP